MIGLTDLQMKVIINMMRIKARGHTYDEVKGSLKTWYDKNQSSFNFPYKDLEQLFDQVWSSVIEVKFKEDLK